MSKFLESLPLFVDADLAEAQQRYADMAREAREIGAQPAGLITAKYLKRAARKYGTAFPGGMGIKPGSNGGKPQIMSSYPLGDEAESYAQLAGDSRSVAVHRACRALAIGLTPEDVAWLVYCAQRKPNSQGSANLLAWAAQYARIDALFTAVPQDAPADDAPAAA